MRGWVGEDLLPAIGILELFEPVQREGNIRLRNPSLSCILPSYALYWLCPRQVRLKAEVTMQKLIEGHKRFLAEIFPARKSHFHLLSESQSPAWLFITCADSRMGQEGARKPVMPRRSQCIPSAAFTCFGGFLNSHAAAAQTSASTAVQRKTSIYASIAACWINLP